MRGPPCPCNTPCVWPCGNNMKKEQIFLSAIREIWLCRLKWGTFDWEQGVVSNPGGKKSLKDNQLVQGGKPPHRGYKPAVDTSLVSSAPGQGSQGHGEEPMFCKSLARRAQEQGKINIQKFLRIAAGNNKACNFTRILAKTCQSKQPPLPLWCLAGWISVPMPQPRPPLLLVAFCLKTSLSTTTFLTEMVHPSATSSPTLPAR